MATYIRLTEYRDSESKEQGFFKSENRYEAKQEDFEKIPGSPIAYWVSEKVLSSFKDILIGKIAEPKKGMVTANNDKYLRLWFEIVSDKIGFGLKDLKEANRSIFKWFPYNKGGEYRRWFGNQEYCINWQYGGSELYKEDNFSDRNISFSFQAGLTWTVVTNGNFSMRFQNKGLMLDAAAGVIYSLSDANFKYILGCMNTKITAMFVKFISPTINCQVGEVAKLPIIFPKQDSTKQTIDTLTGECIDISKEEWDSRETSWDFSASPLIENGELRIENGELRIENWKIEDAYGRYCEYWREKFFTLHKNEEELNRIFIDIYELQDELDANVELKDITILKSESVIDEHGELAFKADEIMKQFISYAVGCMFGRYSLEHEGLLIANMGQEIPSQAENDGVAFEIDEDNVIPVLEDDYFKDDITSRFVQFVKVAFGQEHLSENIRFIEKSLGSTLRKYFVKGFYEDHIKRYKKRPIYWMVSSPKKGFMSLVYMHRYKSDTFARVRNSYLSEYIAKLETHKETLHLTTTSQSASDKDKKDADKHIKNIETKLKELIAFDRDAMMHHAQNGVDIDLDDGVKVNYCKFEDILYPIIGLCK